MQLEEILGDLVASKVWQRWVFDQNACCEVVLNAVVVNHAFGLRCGQDARPIVAFDAVVDDAALRVHHYDSVVVTRNLIVLNHQAFFALYYENALRLRVLNVVELDLGFTGALASQCDVCLDV